jgi:hypothetical protein
MAGGNKGKAGKPSKQPKVPSKKKNKLSVSSVAKAKPPAETPLDEERAPALPAERTDDQITKN